MDEYKRTPLHYVCIDVDASDRVASVSRLVSDGYDVDAKDENEWIPLHFAAQEGDEAVIGALLEAGADINLRDKNGLDNGANPNVKNHYDVSAYDIAPEFFGG